MPYRRTLVPITALLLHACTAPPPSPPSPARPQPTPPPATTAAPIPEPTIALPEPPPPAQPGITNRAEVRAFIAEMARKHGFATAALANAFERTALQPAILDAMAKPYEAKPWYDYRKLFLTDKRIQGGLDFKAQNAAALARAESRYGVSRDIVTAIIGVESSYGAKPGKYKVIDALSTLAFAYPKRAGFFRGELEQFLLLCREEGMDYLEPVGSYAGAMGMPQFMPSSYRKLAADGDGDGKRDIWNNPADAIASVARYFSANGWHTGEPIATPARVNGGAAGLASKNPKFSHNLNEWVSLGAEPVDPVPGNYKAGLVTLPGETGPEYWLAFHNFDTIMRYNHSPLYAMAAYELSRAIRR
ncbi:murein transglycosylase [Methylomagnum ishizawai]|nr:murein transglycosylase [Methylomagnum ishizawai]